MKNNGYKTFTVYIEKDEDGIFVGSIPTIQSCYAEGKTKAEMLKNLKQVAKLCLRNQKNIEIGTFVGIQNIDLTYA